GRRGRRRLKSVQCVHSCTFGLQADMRVVFQHRLAHVASNGHHRLVWYPGLGEFCNRVMSEIMKSESLEPGIGRQCSPARTPRDHWFLGVVTRSGSLTFLSVLAAKRREQVMLRISGLQ